jgi:hypothetical protein
MKKKIPLSVLESIRTIVAENQKLIKIEDREDSILSIVENDKSSKFYFRIKASEIRQDGHIVYILDFSPRNPYITEAWNGTILANEFNATFTSWFKNIVDYNQPHILFNDPILESYYNELEADFVIVDEDANTSPFKFQQQEHIMNVYDIIIKQVLAQKEEDNEEEATEILKEIQVAKKQLPKSTKKEATNTLRKVIALCKKYSYAVAKAISAEVLVEIGKTLLIG